MKLISIVTFPLLFIAQTASAAPDLGLATRTVDETTDVSASMATQELLDEVEHTSPLRGLRKADGSGGLFNNGEKVAHDEPRHPKLIKPPENVTVIEDEYIVVLDESTADVGSTMKTFLSVVNQLHPGSDAAMGFGDLWNIRGKFKGQAVRMSEEQAETMSELGGVQYIEYNTELVIENRLEKFDSGDMMLASESNPCTSGSSSLPDNWNLDRIDQRKSKIDGRYTPRSDGSGVLVVILDAGILGTHDEFKKGGGGSRVTDSGPLIPNVQRDCKAKGGSPDRSGTFNAAIVGGKKYGVATGVELLDIWNFDPCSTYPNPKAEATAIKAHYLSVLNHIGNIRRKRVVVNGSFLIIKGTDNQNAVKAALVSMIDYDAEDGVVFVTDAGDERDRNTCTFFPANLDETISVGATELNIIRNPTTGLVTVFEAAMKDTNTRCADIYAPGNSIISATASSNTACMWSEGSSSFAAPHVTGAVAMLLKEFNDKSPREIKEELLSRSGSTLVDIEIDGKTEEKHFVYVGR